MAFRPAWSGHLKLSLVTCPVALYKATEAAKRGVSFNLINPETGSRVKMKPRDAGTGEEVERGELVKGHAVDKGLYVTLTDQEIRSVQLDSNGAIAIERFVPVEDIDRLYWDTPYFLVPDGDLAHEPFAVIREAMREAGQVALARVVMSGRERLLALEPRGKGIIAHKIRTHGEVRSSAELFDALPDVKPDAGMVAIAQQILKQHEGPFDPTAFVDRYQAALQTLLDEKRRTQGLTRAGHPAAPDEGQVLDLMAALKASLAGKPASGARRPAKPRRAANDAAPVAKPQRGRKASA